MKKFSPKALALAALLSGVVFSAHADWTFTGPSSATNSTPANASLTSMSGVAITNGASNVGFGSGATWATTALTSFPGIGMCSDPTPTTCSAPNHALDNNVRTEALILGFASSVVLTSVGLSYTHNGTTQSVSVDASVFRYTGSGTPPSMNGLAGATGLAGWELVGNYGNMLEDTSNPYNLINSTGKGSSWWMISAYNSGFTGAGESIGALDNGNDYFKVSALAGSNCTSAVAGVCGPSGGGVPEPGSLALAGLALVGVFAARRKTVAAA